MPYSSNTFDDVLIDQVLRLKPDSILDIGAGAGKNAKLIKKYFQNSKIDAIEPTIEYTEKFNLNEIYDNVFNMDLKTFILEKSKLKYDLIIIGDVLEHFFKSEALDYLDYLTYRSKWIICIWPTGLLQNDAENNLYEIHKNNLKLNDLTSNFEIVYYVKNFGWFYPEPEENTNLICDFHYCVIKGLLAKRNKYVYNFPNWKS
jgi:SAM-dependent methyltransferase